MAEWFKALVLKTSVRETVPWVRIPPSPPVFLLKSPISLLFAQSDTSAFGAFTPVFLPRKRLELGLFILLI